MAKTMDPIKPGEVLAEEFLALLASVRMHWLTR